MGNLATGYFSGIGFVGDSMYWGEGKEDHTSQPQKD